MSRLPVRHRPVASVLLVAALLVGSAASASAEDGSHTVRRGETLSDIAARNHTTIRALADANGIANPNRIIIGQVLVLPSSGASTPATVVHVVAPGETLSDIAGRYGTTSSALAEANGIGDRNLIPVGARLTVPAGGASAGPAAATTSHIVARGETLGDIAGRYGTSVGAIVSASGISNPNIVQIGQSLNVPVGSAGSSATGSLSAYAATGNSDGNTGISGSHTVAGGETLNGIARQYGVTVEALAAANGIPRPWTLYADTRLNLTAPNRLPVDIGQCPVAGATFVNDWGFPRSGGRAHTGTDMFAARGTPVRAPVGGTLSNTTGTIGGYQFRLAGDDGMLYMGSHMEAFGTAGRVEAGAVIGYVGSSGNAAGGRPHLHLEIHPDGGAAMNPYPVLRAAC